MFTRHPRFLSKPKRTLRFFSRVYMSTSQIAIPNHRIARHNTRHIITSYHSMQYGQSNMEPGVNPTWSMEAMHVVAPNCPHSALRGCHSANIMVTWMAGALLVVHTQSALHQTCQQTCRARGARAKEDDQHSMGSDLYRPG